MERTRNLLPDTLEVASFGLDSKLAFRCDLASNPLDLLRENSQLTNHVEVFPGRGRPAQA